MGVIILHEECLLDVFVFLKVSLMQENVYVLNRHLYTEVQVCFKLTVLWKWDGNIVFEWVWMTVLFAECWLCILGGYLARLYWWRQRDNKKVRMAFVWAMIVMNWLNCGLIMNQFYSVNLWQRWAQVLIADCRQDHFWLHHYWAM